MASSRSTTRWLGGAKKRKAAQRRGEAELGITLQRHRTASHGASRHREGLGKHRGGKQRKGKGRCARRGHCMALTARRRHRIGQLRPAKAFRSPDRRRNGMAEVCLAATSKGRAPQHTALQRHSIGKLSTAWRRRRSGLHGPAKALHRQTLPCKGTATD